MVKINRNIILKVLALLLCLYVSIIPFFQTQKVKADALGKFKAYSYVVSSIIFGLKSVGFIGDTTLTPENLDKIYNKADEYLHKNFSTELEYLEALRQVDQLGFDIISGAAFLPGKYSGKLWYSFVDAIKDVLYPQDYTNIEMPVNVQFLAGFGDVYVTYKLKSSTRPPFSGYTAIYRSGGKDLYFTDPKVLLPGGSWGNWGNVCDFYVYQGSKLMHGNNIDLDKAKPPSGYHVNLERNNEYDNYIGAALGIAERILALNKNFICVPSLEAATANKIKLPTRLPQSVINNINNYIDNSTENLIINPTSEELPQLPDNYNPNTDPLPDLPGYEDITPDHPGTTDPEPTPSPTPEPTPQPTPPQYDGSEWVNPIGNFLAGLLEFLKSAFIPTLSIDTSPLTNANFDMANKFPFSLPNTLKTLFVVVNADGKTPVFDMTFDMTKLGFDAPIVWHIDLHEWDTGASVAKTSIYIIFLVGLILLTKKLFVK